MSVIARDLYLNNKYLAKIRGTALFSFCKISTSCKLKDGKPPTTTQWLQRLMLVYIMEQMPARLQLETEVDLSYTGV